MARAGFLARWVSSGSTVRMMAFSVTSEMSL